jgi:ELWxxDGT repeat protein
MLFDSIQKTNIQSLNTGANLQGTLTPASPLETLHYKGSSSLTFIDADVKQIDTLIAGMAPGTEIHILKSGSDAITQITETLLHRQGISSLNIISHGSTGSLDFASNSLNAYNIRSYTEQLQSWGNALTENADILLYGCNVAENALGKAFVEIIRQVTGADVAASSNLTGNFAKGGDWELEYKAGSIEASSVITEKGAAQFEDTLMTPSLVANLNTRTTASIRPLPNASSNPANLININNVLFFTADDGMSGTELWRLDPGNNNPSLVRDLNTNLGMGSNPSNLTNANNVLYFTADDGIGGAALWRLDSFAGAMPSRIQISTNNSTGYNPSNLININGMLYFTADDGSGTELWRINTSTGTPPSPMRFDINTRPGVGSNPSNLINVNNVLYFTADDGSAGTELWRFDTLNSTTPTRVTEVRPGEASSNPANLTNINGILYFTADNGNSGTELWRLDSTGNPVLLDINTRTGAGSNPANLTNVNGILYFTADEGFGVNDLMQIDTSGKAVVVQPVSTSLFPDNPTNLTNVNGTLYFTATTNAGNELWRLDASGRSVQVQDIAGGSASSNPSNLTNINGTLYFTTNDGRIWFVPPPSQTSPNLLSPVAISTPFPNRPVLNSSPLNFTSAGGNLYFTYDEGNIGAEIWRITLNANGTPTNNGISLVRDIRLTPNVGSNPSNITNVNGTIYFTADDGIRGTKLWQLDASGNPVPVIEYSSTGTSTVNGIFNPSNLTNVNGTLYFTASEGMSGNELWRLSPGGSPVRVTDIRPGVGDSNPSNLTNLNGVLFFTAGDGMYGSNLWVIDKPNGTPIKISFGTSQVVPNTSNLTTIGNSLFFTANDGTNGTELWRITPSPTGAIGSPTLINIRTRDFGGSNPSNLTDVNGILFFTADDSVGGRELWWMNPGDNIPNTISIRPGTAGSNPSNLTNINGRLYFSADDGINGTEIWFVDTVSGNLASPTRVEVRSGAAGSNPRNFTNVNGTLYFTADNGRGVEVFRLNSSGSVSPVNTASPATDGISNPTNLVSLGDSLFFSGFQKAAGRELWRVDSAGNLGFARNIRNNGSSELSNFVNINGTVYFVADDGTYGRELWRLDADGNSAMVGDIRSSNGFGSNPSNFIDVNGVIYFTADDGNSGTELWRISGTNTTPTLVRNINPLPGSNFGISYGIGSNPSNLTNVNGVLYFTADDGNTGRELWRIDSMGTPVLVRDINTLTRTGSNPSNLTNVNGILYFTANSGIPGTELWRIDATGDPVMVRDINTRPDFGSNPAQLTNINGTLYFTADAGSGDRELWRIDGAGNAVLVRDINTGYNSNLNSGIGSDPSQLTNINGILYFTANDGASGRELWRIDGTGNAVLIRDINTRTSGASSNPSQLTNINGVLYFTADDGLSGTELWRIDGIGNVVRVRDINTNAGNGSNPSNLTNVNGTLYFTANDGVTGRELWRIDAMGNAVPVFEINTSRPGAGSNPSNLTVVNNILYFVAEDFGGNRELWRIDLLGGSPVRLEIQMGGLGSHPSQLTNFNGMLYFTAEDRIGNTELWRINRSGTPELVRDIRSGIEGSNPSNLFSTNNALYFTANDGMNGTELWRIDNLAPSLITVTKSGNEDSTISFTTADFTTRFNDPEGNPLSRIRIVSLPTNGTLRLGTNDVIAGQEILVADIGFLTFTPNLNFNGSVNFSWNGSDGSRYSMGNGTVSISVTPVNDLPTLSNVSKSGDEDRVIKFGLSDFSSKFTDVDGNALNRIRITSLPSNGKLMLGAADVTLNQEIAAAEIANLNFVPDANFSGTVSFGWNGFDGSAYATANSTVSITINPTPEWQIAATTDFTGDGKQDILQRDPSNGAYRLWYLDANNASQTVALPTMGSNWQITSIANFDGNTSKDIFWQSTTGENRIWRMGTIGTEVVNLPTANPNNLTIQHIGDFEGDGDTDILVRDKTNGMIAIWESNPNDPEFIRQVVLGYVPDNNTTIKQVSDLDGDRDLDVLWYNPVDGAVSVWEMQANSIKSGFGLPTVSDTNTKMQLVADFDGDNDMDILWYNGTNGFTAIWEMDGVNLKQGVFLGYVGDTNTQIKQIVDFDGDKDLDILWYNDTTGFMAIWEMNGVNLKQGIGLADSGFGDTKIQQIADFDGDNDLDFLWYNSVTGFTGIWQMNGVNFQQGITLGFVSDTNTKISQIADFDGDKDLDFLWHNQATGFTAMWNMNGVNIGQGVVLPNIDAGFKVHLVGDFNGDGKLDVVWNNSTTSATKVWLTDGIGVLNDILLPS